MLENHIIITKIFQIMLMI